MSARDDDDRGLTRVDLALALSHGLAAAALLWLALLCLPGVDVLVDLAERALPFAPGGEREALARVAGAVLLGALVGAGVWRARRGPAREVTRAQAVLIPGLAVAGVWFWAVMAAALLA
ncbi:MAG: hypothetical protein M9894_09350 [Planctomycetes bacterium]|nr:hypothetical protein [Planctomycetota bacterium]